MKNIERKETAMLDSMHRRKERYQKCLTAMISKMECILKIYAFVQSHGVYHWKTIHQIGIVLSCLLSVYPNCIIIPPVIQFTQSVAR